jgi:4-oxalocrotonate tautomerase
VGEFIGQTIVCTWESGRNLQGSMSGDGPDARGVHRAEHDRQRQSGSDKEDDVPLIQVKLIQGVFTAPQRQEIVQGLSEAMVQIAGEGMRRVTWCIVEEVPSGEWGIGGQPLSADDVRALASGASDPG